MGGGGAAEPLELFVPGRLAIFGEHSDWAGAMLKQVQHNHKSFINQNTV